MKRNLGQRKAHFVYEEIKGRYGIEIATTWCGLVFDQLDIRFEATTTADYTADYMCNNCKRITRGHIVNTILVLKGHSLRTGAKQ